MSRTLPVPLAPLCLTLALLFACTSDTPTEPATGTLRLEPTVAGDDRDPDGFTLQIDSGPATALPAGAVLLRSVAAGDYRVTLGGVAANCTVPEGNSRTVTVHTADTTVVTFAVSCAATTGSVRVTTLTTGPASDPDGFFVFLDGRGLGHFFGDTTVRGIPPGSHVLELREVAPTCDLAGSPARPIDVVAGGTDSVDYALACVEPTRIAFTKSTPGFQGLWVMNHDGTEPRELFHGLAIRPRWSPDHSRIAFFVSDLFAVDADGSGLVNLTASVLPGAPHVILSDWIAWSPDGSTVAFHVDVSQVGNEQPLQIWLAASDGSGARPLVTKGMAPAWSPDGRTIAFLAPDAVAPYPWEIWTVGPDGGGLTQVTHLRSPIATGPIWSPDGSRILFQHTTSGTEIWPAEVTVVPAEGGQATSVTPGMRGWEPTWVAHGDSIQYLAEGNLVTVVSADGSGGHVVSDLSGLQQDPPWPLSLHWSANGREALVTRYLSGDRDIYTVNADGTHPRNLTRDAASWEQDPDW